MMVAGHAHAPYESESILVLKIQKTSFEVMRAGKKKSLGAVDEASSSVQSHVNLCYAETRSMSSMWKN